MTSWDSGEFEHAVGAAVVFFLAVFVGVPGDPARASGIVDVYTHFPGCAVGFVATHLAFRVDDPTLRVPPPPGERSA